MALDEMQWQIRDLVLGPGTVYWPTGANPFALSVRAAQGGPRAWNHGEWSGAEWAQARRVPMRVLVRTDSAAAWLQAHQQLVAAFAPVGDSNEQVELRFRLGGQEFVLFGRPRLADPDPSLISGGVSYTRCEFVAQDPRIYTGAENVTDPIILPTQAGGLLVPFTVPLTVGGVRIGGEADLLNEGTAPTGLILRIDGPAIEPRVTLQQPDGTNQSIRFNLSILSNQWIEVDTASRTAFLNGLPQSSVRGRAVWDMDTHPLKPGTNVIRFGAADFTEATLTARWRSAWW